MKRPLLWLALAVTLMLITSCPEVKPNQTPENEEDATKVPNTVTYSASGAYEWNFLVYMAADNNLDHFAIDDINEMELVGSTEDVNILVFIDKSSNPRYHDQYETWTGTRIYRITKENSTSSRITSTLLKDYGELDSSSPDTLSAFVEYANTHYPANRTILTLWNHGTGIYPRSATRQAEPSRAIGQDETTSGIEWQNLLLTDELREALEPHTLHANKDPIDIINMDACLMQMFEVGWELSGVAKVLTAAQSLVPGGGNNYTSMLTKLTQEPTIATEDLATWLVDDYYNTYVKKYVWNPQSTNEAIRGTSYSAVSLEQLELLKDEFAQLSKLLAEASVQDLATMRNIRANLTSRASTEAIKEGGNPDYIDLIDFLTEVAHAGSEQSSETGDSTPDEADVFDATDAQGSVNTEIQTAINALLPKLQAMVLTHKELGIYADNGTEPLKGISINLPATADRASRYFSYARITTNQGTFIEPYGYQLLQMAQETQWDNFIVELSNGQ